MSDEISFGDIQRPEPNRCLRPDQDSHFAVVPVANPHADDLPIYIDIDTVKDIEAHAVEDTSIELGGVLLGGQYVDDAGNAFVLVKDSLRAQHYQATQSSFTFTHETWETICKQKDQFPAGTEIVGWYHTHPDFGIFLSGMDMFICNGFFNGPLDVALVVDPIRQDRGWFHWVDQEGQATKRQTGGYYLYGSRFRYEELKTAAGQLIYQRDNVMRGVSQINQQPTSAGGTVQIIQSDQKSTNNVIIASLTIQTLLLAGIFYLVYQGQQVEKQKVETAEVDRIALAEAEKQAVKDLLSEFAKENLTTANGQKRIDVNRLIVNQQERNETETKFKAILARNETLQKNATSLSKSLETARNSKKFYQNKNKELDGELESLKKEMTENQAIVEEAQTKGLISWWRNWVNLAIAGTVLVLTAAGGVAGTLYFLGNKDDEDIDGEGIQTIS